MQSNSKTGVPDFHRFPRIVDNYASLGQKELIKGRDHSMRRKVSLKNGVEMPNKVFGRVQFYDCINNVSVVTENGGFVTTMHCRLN